MLNFGYQGKTDDKEHGKKWLMGKEGKYKCMNMTGLLINDIKF